MQKKSHVIGIGAIVVDQISILEEFPKPDSKNLIVKNLTQVGGPVPTAMRVLSKLGINTSFIGKIGTDEKGKYIRECLKKSGVECSGLIEEKASSGFAQVWVESKSNTRTIAYSTGTLTPIKASDIDPETLPEASILHIDGREHISIKNIIQHFKNKESFISIDTGSFREKTLDILKYVNLIIMPESFALEAFGNMKLPELINQARDRFKNTEIIVITSGKNGSISSFIDKSTTSPKSYTQPAFPVIPVDTTGAGDVHAGSLLYGIVNKWDIKQSLKFAAAASALKCMQFGNTNALPGLDDVFNFIKKNPIL
ncbi:MAG: hypothetical protein KAS64_01725 [Spirochaetes bacterium]|nr:hypothetical protein [Spirochaetota bacterium]